MTEQRAHALAWLTFTFGILFGATAATTNWVWVWTFMAIGLLQVVLKCWWSFEDEDEYEDDE